MNTENISSTQTPVRSGSRVQTTNVTPTNVEEQQINLQVENESVPLSKYPGHPLQVVAVKEGRVVVMKEALEEMKINLDKSKCEEMAILSVAGPLRTGKSWILDVFIRFLSEKEKKASEKEVGQGGEGGEGGDSQPNIIKSEEIPSWAQDCLSREDIGLFTWRSTIERTTEGIWMYSHPFILSTERDGKICKYAVVLMDTQGLFDHETSKQTNNTVFGVSTLLSSFQILNIQNRLQENTLEELHMFVEFCHTAMHNFLLTAERFEGNSDVKFQTLQILIRDWPHFDESTHVGRGFTEGEAYLQECFRKRNHDKGSRERVLASFEEVSCYLLPHPGKKVTSKTWDGDLSVIDEDFILLLDSYLNRLFSNLPIKKSFVNGVAMTPSLFTHYIEAFVEAFSNDDALRAETLVEALTKNFNAHAKELAFQTYKSTIHNAVGQNYFGVEELKKINEESIQSAHEQFQKIALFGGEEGKNSSLNELHILIEEEYGKICELNDSRMSKILNKYTRIVFVAVIAFAIDWASDWICDWWLDTCKDISSFLYFLYASVTLSLVYIIYDIYNTKGLLVATRSVTTLANDCLELGRKVYLQVRDVLYQPEKNISQNTNQLDQQALSKKKD